MQEDVFFKLLFGPSATGYICLAFARSGSFQEVFFKYPEQLEEISTAVKKMSPTHNVYFCPQLLDGKKRTKARVKTCPTAWADLDTCDPDNLLVKPTVVVETSPGRWQAYWVFDDAPDPYDAESLSRRIAYYHAYQGCDRSGWDLTQLMRVPFTRNFKYEDLPDIKIINAQKLKYRPDDFKVYPAIAKNAEAGEYPFPDQLPETSGADLLDRYATNLPAHAWHYFENTPQDDWSKPLWSLMMLCLEVGMSKEETFIVARDSKCNKFARDGRSEKLLWNDVVRSWARHEENKVILAPAQQAKAVLLTEEERKKVPTDLGFVTRYIDWASSLGDAARQYHQAGAFTILSTLLAGSVILPTSFGTIKPNVWFMLLADTTLTRKSTAMDIAMDLLTDVDSSPLLATDGSIEGLLSGLAARPSMPSILFRDEFSGFLEQMVKKDYMGGMAETLTKLYDGKLQKRLLRKETITIADPCLILLTGGIKNKVCSLLTHEFVSSGFIPRFIFITAESNTDGIRPMGPPGEVDTAQRDELISEMRSMAQHYVRQQTQVMSFQGGAGVMSMQMSPAWRAHLSPVVWDRYNLLEKNMMETGIRSDLAEIITPTYDRLSKSTLRIAVLIAGSQQRPEPGQPVQVELEHLYAAIQFAEGWRDYVDEVIRDIGHTTVEREMQRVLSSIKKTPGITRGRIMQNFHLTARNAALILETLDQRGLIVRTKRGRGEILTPVGS